MKSRGPGILCRITWPLIAKRVGRSVHTVKKWGTGKGRKFNPKDLDSVLDFLLAYPGKPSDTTTGPDSED